MQLYDSLLLIHLEMEIRVAQKGYPTMLTRILRFSAI